MAHGHKIQGHFVPIPTEISEALPRIRIPGEARQVLDGIFRQLYGYDDNRQKEEAWIAESLFMEITRMRKDTMYRGVNTCLSMNLIRRNVREGKTFYTMMPPSAWKPLPKKVRGGKKATSELQISNHEVANTRGNIERVTKKNLSQKVRLATIAARLEMYPKDFYQSMKREFITFAETVAEKFDYPHKVTNGGLLKWIQRRRTYSSEELFAIFENVDFDFESRYGSHSLCWWLLNDERIEDLKINGEIPSERLM